MADGRWDLQKCEFLSQRHKVGSHHPMFRPNDRRWNTCMHTFQVLVVRFSVGQTSPDTNVLQFAYPFVDSVCSPQFQTAGNRNGT